MTTKQELIARVEALRPTDDTYGHRNEIIDKVIAIFEARLNDDGKPVCACGHDRKAHTSIETEGGAMPWSGCACGCTTFEEAK